MILRRIATASTLWVSVALLLGTHYGCNAANNSPYVIATSDSAGTVMRARRKRRRRKAIEEVYDGVHNQKAPLSEHDIVNTFAGVLPERRKSDLELHLLQDEEDLLWRQMGGAKMSMDPTPAPNAAPTNGGGGGDGGGGDGPTQAPNAAPTNGGGGGDGSPTASPDATPSAPTINLSPTASPDATPSTPSESPAQAPPTNATPTPDGSGGGGTRPPSSDAQPAVLPSSTSTEAPTILRTLAPTPAPSDTSGSNRIVVASSVGGVVLVALLFCVAVFTCEFKKGAGA